MKLEFDGNQDYQLEAIQAVIDIFEGQSLAKGSFEVSFRTRGGICNPASNVCYLLLFKKFTLGMVSCLVNAE